MSRTATFVRVEPDWEILFVDGEKVCSGHSISATEALVAVEDMRISLVMSESISAEEASQRDCPIDEFVRKKLFE